MKANKKNTNRLIRFLKASAGLNALLLTALFFAFSPESAPEKYLFIGDSNGTGRLPELLAKASGLAIENLAKGSNSFPAELSKTRPAGRKIVMLGTNYCKDTTAAKLYIQSNPEAIFITPPDSKLADTGIADCIKRNAPNCIDFHRFTAGWGQDKSLLSDGIHFTAKGRNLAALFLSEELKMKIAEGEN